MTALSRRSFIFMTLALAACKRGAADFMFNGQTMGTTYTIVAVTPSSGLDQESLRKSIESDLATVDQHMSNWNTSSEISSINAHDAGLSIPISNDMETLLRAAQLVHEASDGQFDLTLGPLIDLWGFGAQTSVPAIPSDAQIAHAQRFVGQSKKLTLTDGALRKSHAQTQMYLSAIGKGFGVDRLGDTLKSFGVTDFMVEIGGDIVTAGKNGEGMPWRIGIETPDHTKNNVQEIVAISDIGLATSGDYRNYFEHEGERFSHILDAKSGRPVTHATASVTVLAENAMLADAWATGLLALGRDRGLEIAEREQLAAFFIERDVSSTKTNYVTTASTRFAPVQRS